jgi:hypothetical protein
MVINKIISFLQKNILEIQSSRHLQIYGFFLCCIYALTAFFWRNSEIRQPYMCWTFFQSCQGYSQFIHQYFKVFLIFTIVLSMAGAILFLKNKIRLAYPILVILFLVKYMLHISDYRMMGNYHYMHHVVVLLFLFIPEKLNTLKLFIVLFYVSPGLLKVNPEWLSGAALNTTLPFGPKVTQILLFLVLYLEFIIVWFLLLPWKRFYQFALLSLFCFHIFSFFIVGYFFPLVMFCILTIFILDRSAFSFPVSWFGRLVMTVFVLCQLYPLLFETHSDLTGRGRLISLNMFDASTNCDSRYYIEKQNMTVEYAPDFTAMAARIRCDPLIVYHHIQRTCKNLSQSADFIDMDIDHQIKRSSHFEIQEQMTFLKVCTRPLKISILGRIWQP